MSDSLLPTEEEYRSYDRVWQRVSPQLNPYPELRGPRPLPDERPLPERRPACGPGEPCCMGPVSETELDALRAAVGEELEDAQVYRYLSRQAPAPAARHALRAMAEEEAGHARSLRAMLFLLSGETLHMNVPLPPQNRLPWRDRLRELCRRELDSGTQYLQLSRQTRDTCLRRLYRRMSRDEFNHADRLRGLLEQAL